MFAVTLSRSLHHACQWYMPSSMRTTRSNSSAGSSSSSPERWVLKLPVVGFCINRTMCMSISISFILEIQSLKGVLTVQKHFVPPYSWEPVLVSADFVHIVKYLSYRTWKWAQKNWWTSSTESFQSVRCVPCLESKGFYTPGRRTKYTPQKWILQNISPVFKGRVSYPSLQVFLIVLYGLPHCCDSVLCSICLHFDVFWKEAYNMVSCISDGDLKTDGFSIESCRSMVAVMDVSFLSL